MVTLDGAPWFVAKDVLTALGMDADQPQNYLRHIGGTEKIILQRNRTQATDARLFIGQANRITVISESGLYKLVMRSDKPQAKPFQDWVTKEVLPSIRKTGAFVTGQPSRCRCRAAMGRLEKPRFRPSLVRSHRSESAPSRLR